MTSPVTGIEGLRVLTETTFDGFPDSTIQKWIEEAVKQYDDLKQDKQELIERVKELEHGNRACAVAIRDMVSRGDIKPLMVGNEALDEIVNKFAIDKKIEALEECVGVCGFLSCEDSLKARIKQLRHEGE
ncbi:MAG: hypothetical protein COB03_18705 [Alteromonas sp.]|nr:MAG: hypothetical protein COB03_18705 [Alteromonas sp.]